MCDQTPRKKERWDIWERPPANSRSAVGRLTRSTRAATFLGDSTAARRSTISLSPPYVVGGSLAGRGKRERGKVETAARRRRREVDVRRAARWPGRGGCAAPESGRRSVAAARRANEDGYLPPVTTAGSRELQRSDGPCSKLFFFCFCSKLLARLRFRVRPAEILCVYKELLTLGKRLTTQYNVNSAKHDMQITTRMILVIVPAFHYLLQYTTNRVRDSNDNVVS